MSDTGLADQRKFLQPVYRRLPPGMRPPATSFAQRILDWVPVQDLIAQVGFSSRFDRTVARLARHGGHALSTTQSRLHFGDRLIVWVDPKTIHSRLRDNIFDGNRAQWIGSHFLDGGNWKHILQPLDQSSSHAEIIELCQFRQNFRDGAIYRRYADQISNGTVTRRNRVAIDTIDKLDSYFEYYLALIEDIEKYGIVPSSDLRVRDQTGRRHRWTRSLWQDLAERDIGVAISANGRLVRHTNGKHRMAIALALGIDRIPAEIRLVHARWLLQRSERLNLSPIEALLVTLERARSNGWHIK